MNIFARGSKYFFDRHMKKIIKTQKKLNQLTGKTEKEIYDFWKKGNLFRADPS